MFKSIWRDSPGNWNQPELASHFQLLRSVTSLCNKALDRARVDKEIRGFLEGQATVYTDSESAHGVLSDLTVSQAGTNIEFSLGDCLGVSDANLRSDLIESAVEDELTFIEEDTVRWPGEEGEARVQVAVAPVCKTTGHDRCSRCWKWVCQEGEDLCGRCRQVEHEEVKLKMSERHNL